MKKILALLTVMVIGACGIQRPMPLTISLISPSGLPYEQQGGMKVQTASMYNIRVDWDVTNTSAQGVKIIIAAGEDYNCDTPIASKVIWGTLNSTTSNLNNSVYSSLGKLFEQNLNLFAPGLYSICIAAVQYDRESSPSIPVFMELTSPQGSAIGYYYGSAVEAE